MSNVTNEYAVSQEISALEQQMRYANELRAKVQESTDELTNKYLGLINCKQEFEQIKKENIEELRRYKFSISVEVKEIEDGVKRMIGTLTKDRLEQLKEFASVCERLDKLRTSGFFENAPVNLK